MGLSILYCDIFLGAETTPLQDVWDRTPTALRPDVIVLDETQLSQEPFWQTEPVITNGASIPLVVEVVSTNWQDDYARKVEEYAFLGIPEYWIVDFRALGCISFIGKPKQPMFTVCTLVGDRYQQQQYRLGEPIASPTLPHFYGRSQAGINADFTD